MPMDTAFLPAGVQSEVQVPCAAAELDADFGRMDFSSDFGVVMFCSDMFLHQLRAVYQHELAYRWLQVSCVLNNSVVLDESMMRILRHEISHSSSVSLAKAAVEVTDPCVRVLRQLRGSVYAVDEKRQSTNNIKMAPPNKAELSHIAMQCQFPSTFKSGIRSGIAAILRDSSRSNRHHARQLLGPLAQRFNSSSGHGSMTQLGDASESYEYTLSRQKRACFLVNLKTRYLAHMSIHVAEAACDLSVRVQAADAVRVARSIYTLLPERFLPFRFSTEKTPRVLVTESGSIASIYAVPKPSEMLSLRGLSSGAQDVVRSVLHEDSKLPSLRTSSVAMLALPVLEVDYEGPAYIGLQLVQTMVSLVAQYMFWYGIGGNACVLLKHFEAASANIYEHGTKAAGHLPESDLNALDAQSDSSHGGNSNNCEMLRKVRETWNRMEMIRIEFINLDAQMKSIGSKHCDAVFGLLLNRLRVATWRTNLVLRRGVEVMLKQGSAQDVAEVRRWQRHLDGYSLDGHTEAMYLVREADDCTQHVREDDEATDLLSRLTLARPILELPPTGLLSVDAVGYVPETCSQSPGRPLPISRQTCAYLHPFPHALRALLSPPRTDTLLAEEAHPTHLQHSKSHEHVRRHSLTHKGSALEGPPSSFVVAGVSWKSRAPLPMWGRAPWRFPELPWMGLTKGLCLLSDTSRSAIAAKYLDAEMKVDTYLASRGCAASSLDSIQVESEMVQTLITVTRLREFALCALLRRPPPTCSAECHVFDDLYEEKVAKIQGGGDGAEQPRGSEEIPYEEQREEDQESDHGGADDFDKLLGALPAPDGFDLWTVKREMREAQNFIARFLGDIHKVLLFFTDAALNYHVVAVEAVEAKCVKQAEAKALNSSGVVDSHRETSPGDGRGRRVFGSLLGNVVSNPDAALQATSQSREEERGTKAEMLATFNRLRTRGVRVRTLGRKGSDAYVFREQDLDECGEALGRELLQWQRGALSAQSAQCRKRNRESLARLFDLEQQVMQARLAMAKRDVKMHAEVSSVMVENSSRQLFEADQLRRKVLSLTATAFELEHRLGAETKSNVLQDLGSLNTALRDIQGCRPKYLVDLRGALYDEVHHLKEMIFEQTEQRLGVTNLELQKSMQALKEEWLAERQTRPQPSANVDPMKNTLNRSDAAIIDDRSPESIATFSRRGQSAPLTKTVLVPEDREEIEALHSDINLMSWASKRLDTHYRHTYEQAQLGLEHELRSFKTSLSSHTDMWDKCAFVREQAHIIEDELKYSKRCVSDTNDSIERLIRQTSIENKRAAKLEEWKGGAHERFKSLQKEERKYDKVDNYDLPRLVHDLSQLDKEIFGLVREDQLDPEESRNKTHVNTVKHISVVNKKALNRQIALEKELTSKALAKSDLIRRELECGDMMDQENLISLLAEEFRVLSHEIATIESENKILTESLPRAASSSKSALLRKNVAKQSVGTTKLPGVELDRTFEEDLCYSIGTATAATLPSFKNNTPVVSTGRRELRPLHETGEVSSPAPLKSARKRAPALDVDRKTIMLAVAKDLALLPGGEAASSARRASASSTPGTARRNSQENPSSSRRPSKDQTDTAPRIAMRHHRFGQPPEDIIAQFGAGYG
eukprot:TRINITY_DN25591_c0_g1_i2.p1 TRINITY_DN25591_c0_g1~~TRINITY_DN25591_c0_g1_i2.p1  ORF type:complete len:1729 (-),score=256.75 TRINITY_DN25591_c0_g1_i2:157-5013(-)